MRIVLTGGGTGGHIYPALTVAEEMQRLEPGVEFLYLGGPSGLEADLVPRAGLPFAVIQAGGLVRTSPGQLFRGALRMARGVFQAYGRLGRFRPDAVLATGGYVSGPVLLAAAARRIPTALWAGDAYPGSTIRLFSRWARVVFIPYPESKQYLPAGAPAAVLGNPVRRAVLEADRSRARAALGLGPDQHLVLVTGGSQGARAIHRAVAAAAPDLVARPGLRLLHAAGPRNFDEVAGYYQAAGIDPGHHPQVELRPYIYDMPVALAAADLAIARAGAMSTAELAVRGLPAILIPFPHATHNHQDYNARALERRDAAVVLAEAALTPGALAATVLALLDDPARRAAMSRALQAAARPDAAAEIARRVLAVAGRRSPAFPEGRNAT